MDTSLAALVAPHGRPHGPPPPGVVTNERMLGASVSGASVHSRPAEAGAAAAGQGGNAGSTPAIFTIGEEFISKW